MPALDLLKWSNHKKEMQEFDNTNILQLLELPPESKKVCLEYKFSSYINI